MKRTLACALTCFFLAPVRAQQPPDLFSCVDLARLAAPRSATYSVKGQSANYTDVEEVARIEEPGRQLLRITWTRYRDNATTSAQIMHVDARTLAPLSYLHNSARTPDAPPAKLAIQGGTLTGHSYGKRPVNVQTGAQPILFGNASEEMLAPAIDWSRCPSVSALHLNETSLDVRRDISMSRVGEGTFTLEGRELPVYQIAIRKGDYEHSIAVSRAEPFVVVRTAHSTPASTKELVQLKK